MCWRTDVCKYVWPTLLQTLIRCDTTKSEMSIPFPLREKGRFRRKEFLLHPTISPTIFIKICQLNFLLVCRRKMQSLCWYKQKRREQKQGNPFLSESPIQKKVRNEVKN